MLVATGDALPVGLEWPRDELGPGIDVTEDPRSAVDALTDASRAARLLILGSRHLPVALALSSVSEQAARVATHSRARGCAETRRRGSAITIG